jgi:hypothetical protein
MSSHVQLNWFEQSMVLYWAGGRVVSKVVERAKCLRRLFFIS